jgi:TRAP transporter TAXI family solute receptor
MKRNKIIVVSIIFSTFIIGLIFFLNSEKFKQKWIIMSGIEGGKYDEVARALGKVLAQKGGVDIEIKTSSGSRENLTALEQGKADLALLQNDISSTQSVHSITILYEEALHLIVRNDFNSTEQLKGSVIAIGNRGGGTEGIALATLNHMGINKNNITLRRESLETSLTHLENGEVECVCIVTGVGNATISKFLARGKLTLLPIGSNPHDNLKLSYPFIQPAIIPSEAYLGKLGKKIPSQTIPTIGTRVVLACSPELLLEDGYEITRFIQSEKANLTKAHPLFAQMSRPGDVLLQHPIHEGAQLYHERGKPSFIQEWADTIALIFSIIAVTWGAAKAMGNIYLKKLKDSLDMFFTKVDRITSELIKGVDLIRAREIAKELHEIRRETTQKLIAEELAADDSFVIFQRQLHTAQQLVNESLRKSES